jgi:hypothetical protein
MRPTPYPEVNELLKHLVFGVRDILGANFVGAYVFGSLAIVAFNKITAAISTRLSSARTCFRIRRSRA